MGCEKLRDADLRQPEAARRHPAEHAAHAVAGRPAEVGHAVRDAEEAAMRAQAEVFAGYAAYTDHEIGRVIQAVEDMGKLDNTLIIYISGDNGTSAEGTLDRHAQPDDRLQRHPRTARSRADDATTRPGARTRPTRTCRSRGRGRSTRRSSGPSRWRRTSAARGRAWRCRGPATSRTSAASARSSTT